ncbi:MAG TPA: phosphate ABC transporter permease PstA [Thermodesulfobacteriota bacterium]|nr:phosphate ABC transporter permease PstA [Thermodesulfobacteriota bacterium]
MKNFWKSGDPFVWLTGGALIFSLLMIAGLIFLIMVNGLGFFWPSDIARVTLKDGNKLLGEVADREKIPQPGAPIETPERQRIQLKIGNRDIYGFDFRWVNEEDIAETVFPDNAAIFERLEWGNMYGFIKEVRSNGKVIARGNEESWSVLKSYLPKAHEIRERIKKIEKEEIGDINYKIESLRLDIRKLLLGEGRNNPSTKDKIRKLEGEIENQKALYESKESQLVNLYNDLSEDKIVVETVDGREKEMPVGEIVRAYQPNSMSVLDKSLLYLSRLWEFVSGEPRESNTEGGIFPAIFGTVMMVFLMSLAVLPFGVLAALYLKEYARQGFLVRVVRICVNNLAGVPSIVFGVFGLGFFIYAIGGTIDQLFYPEALPTPTYGTGGILWASLTLALLTVPVVIVATEEGLSAVPKEIRHGSLALGATKFETIWKVVIPSSLPAILTGLILAIARATGEVAPLMITGVVKLAPELPLDGHFPYVHLERKFMHLGFHIYDVGFQSPNVEAAKPMVYATTLLLILIVVILNLTAIVVRNRLKKRYTSSVF